MEHGHKLAIDYKLIDEVKGDDVRDQGIVDALEGMSDHRGVCTYFRL